VRVVTDKVDDCLLPWFHGSASELMFGYIIWQMGWFVNMWGEIKKPPSGSYIYSLLCLYNTLAAQQLTITVIAVISNNNDW